VRSGRRDAADDQALVETAIGHAVEAGLPREAIDAELQRAAREPDDDFRHVVCAGRLYALIRLHRPPHPPAESPVVRRDADPHPW